MRMAIEAHGLDSQGKWPLLREPTSRLYHCPSSSQAKMLHWSPSPRRQGLCTGPVLFIISVLLEPSPEPESARRFGSVE